MPETEEVDQEKSKLVGLNIVALRVLDKDEVDSFKWPKVSKIVALVLSDGSQIIAQGDILGTRPGILVHYRADGVEALQREENRKAVKVTEHAKV